MDDSKVFMFPEGNSSSSTDPALMMAMSLNGGFGNWSNNPFIYLVWMWMMRWMNNNEMNSGENYNSRAISQLQDTVNTNHNNDLVLQGINGNASAINELANAFGTNNAIILGAINDVKSAVNQVSAQTGITGERVINSILLGNKDLVQQIASCCCENKQLITTMGYEGQIRDLQNASAITGRIDQLSNGVQTGFASTAYATQAQTNSLQSSLQNQTQTIIDKISQLESNAQQDKINELTAQLTAANSRAERQLELLPIVNQLNAIKAAQPATATITYPNLVAYPSYLSGAANATIYGNSNSFWS